jgi:hypothetical protein
LHKRIADRGIGLHLRAAAFGHHRSCHGYFRAALRRESELGRGPRHVAPGIEWFQVTPEALHRLVQVVGNGRTWGRKRWRVKFSALPSRQDTLARLTASNARSASAESSHPLLRIRPGQNAAPLGDEMQGSSLGARDWDTLRPAASEATVQRLGF